MRRNSPVAFRIVGVGLLVVGLALCAGTAAMYRSTHRMLATAASAPGVVTGLAESHSTDNGSSTTTYAPAFHYADRAGVEHQVQSNIYSNPAGYAVGDQVEVVYDPAHPGDGHIRGFMQLWFGTVFIGIFAVVCTTLGVAMLAVDRVVRRAASLPPSGFGN